MTALTDRVRLVTKRQPTTTSWPRPTFVRTRNKKCVNEVQLQITCERWSKIEKRKKSKNLLQSVIPKHTFRISSSSLWRENSLLELSEQWITIILIKARLSKSVASRSIIRRSRRLGRIIDKLYAWQITIFCHSWVQSFFLFIRSLIFWSTEDVKSLFDTSGNRSAVFTHERGFN